MAIRRPKSNKNPPIFSHEFVIQNHADIVSCVAMVFIIGLMFQATSPVASLFVALQHNVTVNDTQAQDVNYYTCGMKDFFTAFFYFLISIVLHAVVQEYILDKLNRKMHLSKVKHSKFNESGQLLAFYTASVAWGIDILIRENYVTNISSLWEGYPHVNLPFVIKFYFMVQLAYWLHGYPELYFQKVKKEEMWSRVTYTTLYLVFIAACYVGKFFVWDVLFVLVRLGTITLAVLTFWHGLAMSDQENSFSVEDGNYNIQAVRIVCLSAICLLQAYIMWNFITFHLRRLRERSQAATSTRARVAPQSPAKDKKKRSKGKQDDDEHSGDGAASQNGTVRARSTRSKQKL